ncbi:MAG: DUF1573 domain-containing protein [candidate division Zixibacteria bacterium]|nr:DUF1573 domain-containing protein [candidate division Zixibacteria bacterium]
MKKISYLIPILLFIIYFSLASGEKKLVKGPKLFLPEKEWDFGYIPQNSTVSHFFKIKNIGDDTLLIVKVRPGCACTFAPLKKDLLAPQESTSLEVIFNSKNYQGSKTMVVAIFSTDTSNISDINFTANIEDEFPLIQVEPLQVKFDSLRIEKSNPKKVTISNKSNFPLQMLVVEKPRDFIDFQLSQNNLSPKETAEILLQINPKAVPGPFKTNLTLDFSNGSSVQGSEKMRYTLPISGTIISK